MGFHESTRLWPSDHLCSHTLGIQKFWVESVNETDIIASSFPHWEKQRSRPGVNLNLMLEYVTTRVRDLW